MVEKSSTGLMVGTPASTLETKLEFLPDEEEEDEDDEEETKLLKSGIGKVKTLSRISSLRSPVGIANTKVFSASSAAASKLLPADDADASLAGADADEELDDESTELFSSPSL